MEFPLNTQKLNPQYVSAVLDSAEIDILARYNVFKKASGVLVMSFKRQIGTYGSIHSIPRPILHKYHKAFSELFSQFNTLGVDLQRQVNENTKYLEELEDSGAEDSCIYKLCRKKQNRLLQKIKYYDCIKFLTVATEIILNKRKMY